MTFFLWKTHLSMHQEYYFMLNWHLTDSFEFTPVFTARGEVQRDTLCLRSLWLTEYFLWAWLKPLDRMADQWLRKIKCVCVCVSNTRRIDVLSQVWHKAFVLCLSVSQWPCYSPAETLTSYYVPPLIANSLLFLVVHIHQLQLLPPWNLVLIP